MINKYNICNYTSLTWTNFSYIKTAIIEQIAYPITVTTIDIAVTSTAVLKTSINTRTYNYLTFRECIRYHNTILNIYLVCTIEWSIVCLQVCNICVCMYEYMWTCVYLCVYMCACVYACMRMCVCVTMWWNICCLSTYLNVVNSSRMRTTLVGCGGIFETIVSLRQAINSSPTYRQG